jgi:hypothetical protein
MENEEKGMTIDKLNKLYKESESVDQKVFAEQRSNLLLVAGEHYSKKRKRVNDRIVGAKDISEQDKLRLTKNHIQKISSLYVNNILSNSPGVTILPDIETEVQDQKAAELHRAVWEHGKKSQKINSKIRDWAEDFINFGEVATKVFFDPMKGDFKGYATVMDEMGQPVANPEMPGEWMEDKSNPVFKGAVCFESIHAFNLLRAPEAKDMDESRYLIIRKMVNVKHLKAMVGGDEEKTKFIEATKDDTFLVFDPNQVDYVRTKNECLVLEYYFRPCAEYPTGYFFITTEKGIISEGELPFGIFPIRYKGYRKIATTARSFSPIKNLRPYQIEINRCASAIATHQVTLGDDKIVTNNTSKVEQGSILPGVRVIKASGGGTFTILPGRGGDQYLPYMNGQIQEMYEVAMLAEEMADSDTPVDGFQALFKSIKQKKKFSLYVGKFEEYLVDVCEAYLALSQKYLDEESLIPMIGKREIVNIPEYQSMENIGYRIKVESQVDDIETQMGKQLVMNHALQYVGSNMDKAMIGKVLKNMPFGNMKDTFDDMTIDEDNSRNEILALERLEQPEVHPDANHEYAIAKLTHRIMQSDFKTLPPEVQNNFQVQREMHGQYKKQQMEAIQRAEAGFIPTGGYMVKADLYITDDEGKTKRATVPYQAMEWLVKKLEEQGSSQQSLEAMQESAVAGIADQINNGAAIPQNQGAI